MKTEAILAAARRDIARNATRTTGREDAHRNVFRTASITLAALKKNRQYSRTVKVTATIVEAH